MFRVLGFRPQVLEDSEGGCERGAMWAFPDMLVCVAMALFARKPFSHRLDWS